MWGLAAERAGPLHDSRFKTLVFRIIFQNRNVGLTWLFKKLRWKLALRKVFLCGVFVLTYLILWFSQIFEWLVMYTKVGADDPIKFRGCVQKQSSGVGKTHTDFSQLCLLRSYEILVKKPNHQIYYSQNWLLDRAN